MRARLIQRKKVNVGAARDESRRMTIGRFGDSDPDGTAGLAGSLGGPNRPQTTLCDARLSSGLDRIGAGSAAAVAATNDSTKRLRQKAGEHGA